MISNKNAELIEAFRVPNSEDIKISNENYVGKKPSSKHVESAVKNILLVYAALVMYGGHEQLKYEDWDPDFNKIAKKYIGEAGLLSFFHDSYVKYIAEKKPTVTDVRLIVDIVKKKV